MLLWSAQENCDRQWVSIYLIRLLRLLQGMREQALLFFTPCYPKANGQVELANKTVIKIIKSGLREQRVFGQTSYLVCFRPTEPSPVLPQEKLHFHSHTTLRQSYLSNAAFHLQGICGSTKRQTKSC